MEGGLQEDGMGVSCESRRGPGRATGVAESLDW
jgi:hypothetical protein